MSKQKQNHQEDEDMLEEENNNPEDDEHDEESGNSQSSQSKGRPRIQEQWTRVISMKMDNLSGKHSHNLATDLMIAKNLPTNLNNEEDEEWRPAFFPKDFVGTHIGITVENFAINDERLLEYGKQVTNIRKEIREKAERIAR